MFNLIPAGPAPSNVPVYGVALDRAFWGDAMDEAAAILNSYGPRPVSDGGLCDACGFVGMVALTSYDLNLCTSCAEAE